MTTGADVSTTSTQGLPFDLDELRRWLRSNGLGGDLEIWRIGDGLSNLTYGLRVDGRTLVLRRPPPPPLPRGANDMRREAHILEALAGSAVPVPRVLAIADEGHPMDVPCYVMEHVDGVVATEDLPAPIDTRESRAELAKSFIDVLAAVHAVDWKNVGLEDLGRPDGFLERQVTKLPRLIADEEGRLPAPFAEIRAALAHEIPDSGTATLLHGDFRFGNLMLGMDAPPRIVGVLDWELAGIGDPIADLAYSLVTYAVSDEPQHALTEMSTVTLLEGFPDRASLAARYARRTGRTLEHLGWHQAFQLFKLAILFEYNRRKTTTGDGDPYYAEPRLVEGLLEATHSALERHGSTR